MIHYKIDIVAGWERLKVNSVEACYNSRSNSVRWNVSGL